MEIVFLLDNALKDIIIWMENVLLSLLNALQELLGMEILAYLQLLEFAHKEPYLMVLLVFLNLNIVLMAKFGALLIVNVYAQMNTFGMETLVFLAVEEESMKMEYAAVHMADIGLITNVFIQIKINVLVLIILNGMELIVFASQDLALLDINAFVMD